jgi:hypothetical protein
MDCEKCTWKNPETCRACKVGQTFTEQPWDLGWHPVETVQEAAQRLIEEAGLGGADAVY